MMQYKESSHEQLVIAHVLHFINDAVLQEFATQQIRRVLRASMVASAHATKDGGINEFVTSLFQNLMVSVTVLNGGCFIQLILESNRRETETHFVNRTAPNNFHGEHILSLLIGVQR